jgi:hypothetical protein
VQNADFTSATPESSHHRWFTPYLSAIILLGGVVLSYSVFTALNTNISTDWIFLAVLTLITAAFSLKMPKTEVRLSVPDVFIFASILLYGPAIGALTAAIEGLVGSLRARNRSRRFQFVSFNITALSLSAFVAGRVHELTYPHTARAMFELGRIQELAFSLVVLAIWYYCFNCGSLAILIALERRQSLLQVWTQYFSWLGMGYLTAALMAGIISVTMQLMDIRAILALIAVPLLSFFTYRRFLQVMTNNFDLKKVQAQGLSQGGSLS